MTQFREFLRSYWTPAGRRALGNFVGLALGQGLGHVCAFVALILLTRSLGPDAFGRVSFALAVQWYLMLLGGLGAGAILVREVARRPDDAERLAASFLTLVSVGAVLLAALHLTTVLLVPLAADERGLHVALALGTSPLAVALVWLFDAFHRQALSAAVIAAAEVLALTALIVLDRAGPLGLPEVGAVYAGKWAAMTVGQFAVFGRFVRRLRGVVDRATIVLLARAGLPVLVSWLVTMIPLTSGILFVRAYHGEAAAGEYGIATQFATGVYLLGVIGNRILQPHLSGPYGLDRGFVRKLAAFELSFVVVLTAVGWAAGLIATRWFLPADYSEVPAILALLLAAVAAILVAGVAQSYLIRFHRERAMMLVNLGGGLGYVAIALVVIPSGGVMGAAATAALVTGAVAGGSVFAAVRYARHSL